MASNTTYTKNSPPEQTQSRQRGHPPEPTHLHSYLNKPNRSLVDSTNAVSVTHGKSKISTVSPSKSAGAGSSFNNNLIMENRIRV